MLNKQRIWSWTTFLILVLVTTSGSAFAQQLRERQLKSVYNFAPAHMPMELVSISLNGKEIRPDEKILGDDTWLQGVAFRFKNVSGRPISYINVVFRFPTEKGVLGDYLMYGVDSFRGDHRRDSSPPPIQPGATFDLVLTKEKYHSFLYVLDQGGVPHDFEVASYYIETICFDDDPDLIWQGGYLKRRTAGSTDKFEVVGRYNLPTGQQ